MTSLIGKVSAAIPAQLRRKYMAHLNGNASVVSCTKRVRSWRIRDPAPFVRSKNNRIDVLFPILLN